MNEVWWHHLGQHKTSVMKLLRTAQELRLRQEAVNNSSLDSHAPWDEADDFIAKRNEFLHLLNDLFEVDGRSIDFRYED